jgi:hypothetical protein
MTPESPRDRGQAARLALAVAIALTPAIAAIWSTPWFVTQDGPAHLYNAQILAESGHPASPFAPYFAVRWQPLPNWAGHLLYLGLGAILPPSSAERAAATVTLVLLAASTAWLRFRVMGGRGVVATAALAALIGLNVTWLFGFTGFLLGAALFPITLGVWWTGRDRLSARRTLALAGLVVLGYFCHPVGLGLTAFAMVALASIRPGRPALPRTLVALAPLVPLGLIYRTLTNAGGPMRPEWGHLTDVLSPRDWIAQLGWVDPISLAAKVHRPFGTLPSTWNGLAAPIVWLALGLITLAIATVRNRDRETDRRGWGLLAAILLLAGIIGPDTLGASHGHYLPPRIVLLGMVALVPWLWLDAPGRLAQSGRACLLIALMLQSLFVWDYARESHKTAGRLMASADRVGRGQRVAAALLDIRGRFRANPLLHADCLLGVGTGNIIWGDYETTHYYFPVQLRDPADSPAAADLEAIARLEGPANAKLRTLRWALFLDQYASKIDLVLIWGHDPMIEQITVDHFTREPGGDDLIQVWTRTRTRSD